jgi:hypothetical protein
MRSLVSTLCAAGLLSACASTSPKLNTNSSATIPSPAQREYAAKTAASVAPVSVPGEKVRKSREKVTDSTQIEVLKKSVPVIGDDSEMRR